MLCKEITSVLLYKGPRAIRNSEPVVANQGSGYGHRGARLYTTVNVYATCYAMLGVWDPPFPQTHTAITRVLAPLFSKLRA